MTETAPGEGEEAERQEPASAAYFFSSAAAASSSSSCDKNVADYRSLGGPLLSYIWCQEEEEGEEEGRNIDVDRQQVGSCEDNQGANGNETEAPGRNRSCEQSENTNGKTLAEVVKEKAKNSSRNHKKEARIALKALPTPRLEGQTLYLGGEVGSDGNLYFIPGHAPRVLKLTLANNKTTKERKQGGDHGDDEEEEIEAVDRAQLIGPDLLVSSTSGTSQKFKWLRGITIGDVIYGLPCHADCVLRIYVPTQTVTTLDIPYESFYGGDSDLARKQRFQEWKYHGGSVSPQNGSIYGIPQSALHVLKIDPRTERVTLVGPALPGKYKWYGGIVGRQDGAIYGIPHNSPSVLRILARGDGCDRGEDGEQDIVTLHGNFGDGGHKWHGAAAAPSNGVIVSVPANADTVLCIQPSRASDTSYNGESEAERKGNSAPRPSSPELFELGGPDCVRTGRHRSDRKYKYLGAMAGPDGNVYCFPSGSERVLQVDASKRTVREVGPNLHDRGMERLCQNKWQNGVCVSNAFERAVYAVPLAAESVLRIDCTETTDGEPTVTTWPLPEPRRGLAKWEGGVVAPNGAVYTVPNNHKAILRIESPSLATRVAQIGTSASDDETTTAAADRTIQSTPNDSQGDPPSSSSSPAEARQKCNDLPYASGIPTLRSSAHRVKCSPQGRKSDHPRPKDRRGQDTGTTWLPPELRTETVLDYYVSQHNLAVAVGKLLRKCDPGIVGAFDGDSQGHNERLESFRVPAASTWRAVNGGQCEAAQRYLSDRVASDGEFLTAFDRFVELVVLPHLKSRLVQLGVVSDEPESVTFYYQRPPTLRLQPGPAWAQVKAHNDAEYGHQNGELVRQGTQTSPNSICTAHVKHLTPRSRWLHRTSGSR
jgi:hypothetical protein